MGTTRRSELHAGKPRESQVASRRGAAGRHRLQAICLVPVWLSVLSCSRAEGDKLTTAVGQIEHAVGREGANLTAHATKLRRNGLEWTDHIADILEQSATETPWPNGVHVQLGEIRGAECHEGRDIDLASMAAFWVHVCHAMFPNVHTSYSLPNHDLWHEARAWRTWHTSRKEFLEWVPSSCVWRLDWPRVVRSDTKIELGDLTAAHRQLLALLRIDPANAVQPEAKFAERYVLSALQSPRIELARELLKAAPWEQLVGREDFAGRLVSLMPVELRSDIVTALIRADGYHVRACLAQIGDFQVYLGLYRGFAERAYIVPEVLKIISDWSLRAATVVELERCIQLILRITDVQRDQGLSQLFEFRCTNSVLDKLRGDLPELVKVVSQSKWRWNTTRSRLERAETRDR